MTGGEAVAVSASFASLVIASTAAIYRDLTRRMARMEKKQNGIATAFLWMMTKCEACTEHGANGALDALREVMKDG